MTPQDRRRLLHVVDAMDRIDRYVPDGSTSMNDEMTCDAVLRCMTVIGEALGALSPETYAQLPSLPPRLTKAQRNILVHEYWRIDVDVVWATIKHDLPPLRGEIDSLLGDDG